MKYQIESRWPKWARWRKVTAAPHSERWPYNEKYELEFKSLALAKQALKNLRKANSGQFRLVIMEV